MAETALYQISVESPVAPADQSGRQATACFPSPDIMRVKRLIWLYFWLLIFEGALRKWVVPALANPILLVRDPIVLWIYYIAYRNNFFPRSLFVVLGSILAWLTLVTGMIVLHDALLVPIYGFHANFLHLPLILLIARCFDSADVKKVGYWVLILSMPLALIMAMQYQAGSSAWINAGAGEDAKQITYIGEHVRASATFSFVIGPAYFFSLTTAFLIYGFFSGRQYPKWLSLWGALAVGVAAATAGSRTLLGTAGIVAGFALVAGTIILPHLSFKTIKLVICVVLAGAVLSQIPIISDAFQKLSDRIEGANQSEGRGSASGVLDVRVVRDYTRPIEVLFEAPELGAGFGGDTIVGIFLLGNKINVDMHGDSERELARNIWESGPVLGVAYIAFRWSICVSLFLSSLRCARRGETLPFLMCSICGLVFLNGNLGQSTITGFGVFVAGLCLAIAKDVSSTEGSVMERYGSKI